MITSERYIELYINEELVELESQDSLGLHMNSTLFDPTKMTTNKSEYSFSFSIPATPKNNRILSYANVLAKPNKFRNRYPAQVYVDSQLIFDGSLTIKKFSGDKQQYECNLVNIKVNTLEEIFDEAVMTDMEWFVDFQGTSTINWVNMYRETYKYWFPLISYGAFEKEPNEGSGDLAEYTSKYEIDWSNRFYLEDFYPSLQVVETMRKCFETKGYTVQGNVFQDPILTNIYATVSLADGQDPTYNVGNQKFGRLSINLFKGDITTFDYVQDLKHKYFPAGCENNPNGNGYVPSKYNFDEISVTNLITPYNVYPNSASNMIPNGETYVVIPADGWYRITMSGTASLTQTSDFKASQVGFNNKMVADSHYGLTTGSSTSNVIIPVDFIRTMPIEIQLVKGMDPSIELIHGKRHLEMLYPDIREDKVLSAKSTFAFVEVDNRKNKTACYPHEQLGYLFSGGTKVTDPWTESFLTNTDSISDSDRNRAEGLGFRYIDNTVMAYDPVVSNDFICGWTTMGNDDGGGCCAVIKDGYSWSKTTSVKNNALYNQQGYYHINTSTLFPTDVNKNTYPDAPFGTFEMTDARHVKASVYCMVELKKGDILRPVLVQRVYRDFDDGTIKDYKVQVDGLYLDIEAVTPKDNAEVRNQGIGYNTPCEFPYQLNLFNFTNRETKVSEWLKNVQDAFNLSFSMNGKTIDINSNKGSSKDIQTAINLDNRVNAETAETEIINYPKSMAVKYKIDTNEHGAYISVPRDKLEYSNWKNFIDSGFTVIQLDDDSYNTDKQEKSVQFSYTWYDNFHYNLNGIISDFMLPVIEEEEYMIDLVNDQGSMAHRGYKLPQRFVFRTFDPLKSQYGTSFLNVPIKNNPYTSWTNTNYATLYAPKNEFMGVNLSYKDSERSLITEYFNVSPELSSNYVTVQAYITPAEYIDLKNGELVKLDDDLYKVSNIQYNPMSTSKLKLMKK